MSTHIENEVVSMQFDNKHFESNVRTSLSTLEKLKESLKLHDAAKGFENVSKAAKNVNLSPLSGAVDKVGLKFDGLYTIADQALRNITTRVQHYAERIVSAFTIDPVKTGFSEYELKMNSIQTIMASTGESLETVNGYLNELNEYSDKTIYSFSDMTTNIGKFTNAGVELEDAVKAIQGVANVAAVSGANANEASRAMYNFAQALSAGYVKLMDWKSIELANMATVEFKEQLLEAAVAAGTLKKTSDGMYKTLSGTVLSATKNFNESLNDQWMTTEVLINTLGDYADETTEIGQKAFAAAQDVKTFTQMMETLKETAQSGWAQTWELIFGDFEEGKNLWTSINEVLSGLIEKTSKWRNELLGDALDSSWEKMTDALTQAGINIEDYEEEVKKLAKDNGIEIDDMIKEYGSLEKAISALKNPTDLLSKAFDNLFNSRTRDTDGDGLEEYVIKEGDTLSELAEKWNSSVEEIMLLNPFITDPDKIYAGDILHVPKAIEKTGKAAEDAESSIKAFEDALDGVGKTSGRELLLESFSNLWTVIKNLVTPIGKAFREVFEPLKSEDIYNAIDKFHTFTESLVNGESWGDISSSLKDTFKGVFSLVDIIGKIIGGGLKLGWDILTAVLDTFGLTVLDFTAGIGRAITKLNEWLDAGIGKGVDWLIGAVKWLYNLPAVQKIIETFSNAWSKFKAGFTARWNAGKSGLVEWFGRIKTLAGGFSLDNVMNILSSFKTLVIDRLFGTEDGGTIFDPLIEKLKAFGSVIKNWLAGAGIDLDKIKDKIVGFFKREDGTTIFDILKEKIKAFWNTIKSFDIFTTIKEWWSGLDLLNGFSFANVGKAFTSLYTDVIKPLFSKINFKGVFTSITNSLTNFWSSIKEWWSNLDILKGFSFKNIGQAFTSLYSDVLKPIFGSLIEKLKAFGSVIKNWFSGIGINIVAIKDKILSFFKIDGEFNFGESWSKIIGAITNIKDVVTGTLGGILDFFKENKASIMGTAVLVTIALLIKKFFDVIGMVTGSIGFLADIGEGLSSFAKGLGDSLKAAALKSVADAILVLVGAIAIICFLPKERLWPAVGVLLAIAGILAALFFASSLITNKVGVADLTKFAVSMIAVSGALLIFALAAKMLAKFEWVDLGKTAAVLGGFVVIAMILGTITAKSNGFGNALKGFASMMAKFGVALLLMAVAIKMFGQMDNDVLWQGIKAVTVILGEMIVMMAATNLLAKVGDKQSTVKMGSIAVGLGVALLAIAAAVSIFGKMETNALIKGMIAATACIVLMIGLVLATEKIPKVGKDGSLFNVGSMFASMGAALLMIAAAVAIFGNMKTSTLLKGGAAVLAFLAMFVGIMAATKLLATTESNQQFAKVGGTILAFSAALILVAGAIAILSTLEFSDIAKSTAIIGAIGLLFVALIAATKAIPKNGLGVIIALSGALLILVGSVIALSYIGTDKLIPATIAIGSLIGMLALLAVATKGANIKPKQILMIAGLLTAILVVLGVFAAIAIGSLPKIGDKMSEFMESLNKANGFFDGLERLASISSTNPGLIGDIEKLFTSFGSIMSAASSLMIVDALPFTDLSATLSAITTWFDEVIDIVLELNKNLTGVTINDAALDSVLTAVKTLAEAAALAPTTTIAVGGTIFGGGILIDVPMLTQAKNWIVEVAPVVQELATGISSVDVDGDALTTVCTAATNLASAVALAPSVTVGVGGFSSKWIKGAAGLVSWPRLNDAKDWIIAVAPIVQELAESVTSGDAKDLDKDALESICTAVSDLAEAAALAPSVDVILGLADGPWGVAFGTAVTVPLIGRVANFIERVKTPMLELATATATGLDETFNKDNFNAVINGIVEISTAVENAPTVTGGVLANFNKFSGLTVGLALSHPLLKKIAKFIDKVRTPIIDLANATATGLSSEFNATNFEAIVTGISNILTASETCPTIDVGLIAGFNQKFGAFFGAEVEWPRINDVASFINTVRTPIIDLANATADNIPNTFNKENFESIVNAIVNIVSVDFPGFTVGTGIANIHGSLAAGFGLKWDRVTAVTKFIGAVKEPIMELVKATATGVPNTFNKENFESIVNAIVAMASVEFPTFEIGILAGGGGNSVLGIFAGAGVGWSYDDIDGIVRFINDVKTPIISLAEAVSAMPTSEADQLNGFKKENFESIVNAIVAIASIDFGATIEHWGGGAGGLTAIGPFLANFTSDVRTDFDGLVSFINTVKEPVMSIAEAVSTGGCKEVNTENLDSIIAAIVAIAEADLPTKTEFSGSAISLLGGLKISGEESTDFEGFVDFVSKIGPALVTLDATTKDLKLSGDNDNISIVTGIIADIAAAAKDIPDVKWGLLSGLEVTDWDNFLEFIGGTEGQPGIGERISKLQEDLADMSFEDIDKVTSVVSAIGILAKAAKDIPTEEEAFWGIWKSTTNWDGFTTNLPKFGAAMTDFVTNLGEGIDYDTILIATEAVADLALAAGNVAYAMAYGGSFSTYITNFCDTKNGIPALGSALANFSSRVESINTSAVEVAANAVGTISNAFYILGSDGCIESVDITVFESKLTKLATVIVDFSGQFSDVDPSDAIGKISSLVTMLSDMTGINYTGANSFPETLETVASTSIDNFVNAFSSEDVTKDVVGAGESLADNVIYGASNEDMLSEFTMAGNNAAAGFVGGIDTEANRSAAYNAGWALGDRARQGAEDALDENSPSKEFYKIANFGVIGFVNAFRDGESDSYNSGYAIAESATKGLSNAISKVRDVLENDIDTQPTIRPVLDLTDVSAGAGMIQSMFGTPSVGFLTKVGTVSAMMKNSQNGRNGEVISAINDLGKKFGSVPVNTYNINGITYDDGSNVANAIKILTNAAIRERRS